MDVLFAKKISEEKIMKNHYYAINAKNYFIENA
jgi:hypothetical protein